jgi:hypothetical protein
MDYLPKQKSRKSFYIRPIPTTTDFYKKRISEIEKQLETQSENKQISWKYIDRPNASRLSQDQEIYMPYRFREKAIEKTIFGDYFYLKYLLSQTQDVCVLLPNLDLAIDSILLFYDLGKSGIPIPSDFSKLKEILNSNPKWYEKYKETFDMVSRNYQFIMNALKPNDKGPRLLPENPEYNRLIFSLLKRLLESQRIEIVANQKDPIFIPDVHRLEKCLKSNQRYIVFFIRLILEEGVHANVMVMDTKEKTVERFEPHGLDQDFYDEKILDKRIEAYFKPLGYRYIPASTVCKRGIQGYIESETDENYNVAGFCKTWSLLYVLLRLVLIENSEPEMMEEMIEMVMKIAEEYFEVKKNLVMEEEQKEDLDFVIEFLYAFIPEILSEGKQEIEKINQRLGTSLVLNGRMIHSKEI